MGKKKSKSKILFLLSFFLYLYIGCDQKTATVDPGKMANPHFNRAMIYKAQKQYDLSEKAFEEAIRLEPDNEQIHEELRLLVVERKREIGDKYKNIKNFIESEWAYTKKIKKRKYGLAFNRCPAMLFLMTPNPINPTLIFPGSIFIFLVSSLCCGCRFTANCPIRLNILFTWILYTDIDLRIKSFIYTD